MATAKATNISSHEKLKKAYHLAGEAAHDTADQVKSRAKSSAKAGRKRAEDAVEKAEDSIKKHPLISVGCAFLAGWAISKLMK